jgi:hypothetical protein
MLIKVWFIREVHKKIQIDSKYIYWKGVKKNNKIQTNKNIERVQDIQQCSIEYREIFSHHHPQIGFQSSRQKNLYPKS